MSIGSSDPTGPSQSAPTPSACCHLGSKDQQMALPLPSELDTGGHAVAPFLPTAPTHSPSLCPCNLPELPTVARPAPKPNQPASSCLRDLFSEKPSRSPLFKDNHRTRVLAGWAPHMLLFSSIPVLPICNGQPITHAFSPVTAPQALLVAFTLIPMGAV